MDTEENKKSKNQNKKGFILYNNIDIILDNMTDEQAGILFKAIAKFAVQNKEIDIKDTIIKVAIIPIKEYISKNNNKYDKRCITSKENGSKGGRPIKRENFEKNKNLNQNLNNLTEKLGYEKVPKNETKNNLNNLNRFSYETIENDTLQEFDKNLNNLKKPDIDIDKDIDIEEEKERKEKEIFLENFISKLKQIFEKNEFSNFNPTTDNSLKGKIKTVLEEIKESSIGLRNASKNEYELLEMQVIAYSKLFGDKLGKGRFTKLETFIFNHNKGGYPCLELDYDFEFKKINDIVDEVEKIEKKEEKREMSEEEKRINEEVLKKWDKIVQKMKEEFDEDTFNDWISHLDIVCLSDTEIIMSATDHFYREYIYNEYLEGKKKKIDGEYVCTQKGIKQICLEIIPTLEIFRIITLKK